MGGSAICLPEEQSSSGRHSIGDKFDKAAVLATLQANAERKPKAQFKQDTIGKLIDIQSRMTEGKGIGYKRWLTKHNLKVMAQTVKLLQEKGLTDEDALEPAHRRTGNQVSTTRWRW